MEKETLLAGIILTGLGFLFIFKNRDIARGAAKFYARVYTEKNLKVMFKIAGIILILAGIILTFFR